MNNENDNDKNAFNATSADNNPILEPVEETSKRKSPEGLTTALAQFTGTERYYRHWGRIALLTDGVKYLADETGCYWFLDAIASYQHELKKHHDERLQGIQFWRLTVNADKSAVLTCAADSGEPPVITQKIEWTDFPLPEAEIWITTEGEEWIALLPSEY